MKNMETLDEMAIRHHTDKASPQHDYAKIYEKYLSEWRNREFVLLEIGIASGASLRLWQEYFPNAKIYGIDTNEDCRNEPGAFIGNQKDESFLNSVLSQIGTPDIIIDDGGHIGDETVASFKYLFPKLVSHGFYIVEDTHTFYHPLYSGNTDGTGMDEKGRSRVFTFFTQLAGDVDFNGRGMTGNVDRAINFHEGMMPEFSRILDSMYIHPSLWWFKRR